MTSQKGHDPGVIPSAQASPPSSTQLSSSISTGRSPAHTVSSLRPTETPLAAATFSLPVSPPRAIAVPTYHEVTRSGDPRVRAALHRDANRIEVPNPRAWGPPAAQAVSSPPPANAVDAATTTAALVSTQPATQPTPAAADVALSPAQTDGGGWCPDSRVKQWAEGVVPLFPPHVTDHPVEPTAPLAVATPIRSDISERASSPDDPTRPDSRPPTPKPVTVFVSDDEASDAPPPSPHASQAATVLPSHATGQSVVAKTDASVKSATRPSHELPHRPHTAMVNTAEARRGSITDGRPPFRIGAGAPGRWWKKPPSYAFSPLYAAQRVIVYFQFPIKKDTVKQAMLDHFSKWGEVICVLPVKSINQNCEKAMVVFKDKDGARACLSDPTKDDALYRSRGLGGGMPFKLRVLPGEDESTISPVFIKVVADRYDSVPQRTRSASPDRRDTTETRMRHPSKPLRKPIAPRADKLTTLPEKVFVDWVPKWNQHLNKPWHWPRVRQVGMTKETLDKYCRQDTGRPAQPIAEIDLRSHVQEQDFIPRLCDFFGEIVDIRPCKGGSWLVEMATDGDAISVMGELRKIPGLSVQWGKDSNSRAYGGDLPPYYEDMPLTPLSRLAMYLGTPVARDGELPKEEKEEVKESEGDHAATEHEAATATEQCGRLGRSRSHSVASTATSKYSGKSLRKRSASVPPEPEKSAVADATTPAGPQDSAREGETGVTPSVEQKAQKDDSKVDRQTKAKNTPPLKSLAVPVVPLDEFDPRYPHLRRRFLPTSRGRPLRHESVNGVPRFVDDLGVFVGKLVKEKETEESIFRRFSKYGQICGIEYRPTHAITTYATARILYQTRDAVERAIAHENNRESNGSKLKVEERKVLPSDVEIKEMYLDEWDRPVSPSMASQWSPPQYAATSFPAPPPPMQEAPFSHSLPLPMPIHPPPGCGLVPVPMGFTPSGNVPQPGLAPNAPFTPVAFPQLPSAPMVSVPFWTPFTPHSGPPLAQTAPVQLPPMNPFFRPPMSPPMTPHNGSAASNETSPQGNQDQSQAPPPPGGFVPMVYAMAMGVLPPGRHQHPAEPAHDPLQLASQPQVQELQPIPSPSPARVDHPLDADAEVTAQLDADHGKTHFQAHAQPVDNHDGLKNGEKQEPAGAEHATKRSPKILRTEEHDGLLKVVYDPDDLKRWRREMGIPEDAEPPQESHQSDRDLQQEQAAGARFEAGQKMVDKVQALDLGDDYHYHQPAPPAHPVEPPHLAMSFTHTGSSWASMPPSPIPTHQAGPPMLDHVAHPSAPIPAGWDGYGYGHAPIPPPQGPHGGYRDYRTIDGHRPVGRLDHPQPGGRPSGYHRHNRPRPRKDSREQGGHPAYPRQGSPQRHDRAREGTERKTGHRGAEKARRDDGHGDREGEARGARATLAVPAA